VKRGDAYYWAGGRKVPLTASTDVVVDLDSEAAAGLEPAQLDSLRAKGRTLSASLVMVARTDASEALGERCSTAPGVHPVFRSEDGTQIVVLPEVRVEGDDPDKLAAVVAGLGAGEGSPTAAHVTERSDERFVLAPDSGRGDDALALANSLAESSDTDLSQPRFMRIVARPEPRPPD
jgi:hypothetical protein